MGRGGVSVTIPTRFSASDGTLFKTMSPQLEYFIEYVQSYYCEYGNIRLKGVQSGVENHERYRLVECLVFNRLA